jgi:HPt (histidine-containing phosphotransfer) domain-containing protein
MNSASPQSDGTSALLSRLWQRSLPLLMERLATLDATAAAAHTGTLTTDLRERSISEAHKLAGSLGMFGYPDGTELARSIEMLLEGTEPPCADRLTELTTELRAVLFPPSPEP